MSKKYTWKIFGLVACLLYGLVVVSCHKDEDELTEEQIRVVLANAEVVMENVSQIYEASETVEEMAQHLNEIRAIANVEDAYRDDIAICVKIKDGGIIMWCFYPDSDEEEDEKGVNVEKLFKNISKNMASGKEGSLCERKSICLLNVINRSWEGAYDNVVKKFKDELDWDTCIRKNGKVTPDFIVDSMPDYGMSILHTHGCYCDGQHWLLTGQSYSDIRLHLPKLIESWGKDLNRLVVCSKEERVEDVKIMISETFLDLHITKKFPQNSIVFLAACQTLKGNNNIWLKLESKGLGCVLGFNNTVNSVTDMNCCVTFMEEMLNGKAASEAIETARSHISSRERLDGLELLCFPENCDITLVEKPDGDDWVDLGLPSGLMWATRNVSATSPEDYGDYFAWGETQPKEVYDWYTYIYCNGNYDQLTKYCYDSWEGEYGYNGFTDNLTILQPGDDAATANYGGRTPTAEEWQELIDNTTASWATQNGVNGRRFTGSNGNSLFLPAAGAHRGSSLDYASSVGGYWSSSLSTDEHPYIARLFDFNSDYQGVDRCDRRYGLTVRAVRQN